jgi:signal transduction histidine kinase
MVQIGDVLNQSVQMLHPLLDEKAQTMRLEIPDDLPCVRGKAIWLRQMINNLIENAHKYSPENSDIAIKLKNEGDQILLQVIDSGIGIPTSEIPYIFDKHYRGSNLPLDSDGTGLGLAFVKSIVDNHNGRLWCESNENNGTTFTIMLPAAEPII